jgi:hypothetical protein
LDGKRSQEKHDERRGLLNKSIIRNVRAIPLGYRKFGMMETASLSLPINMAKIKNIADTLSKQTLHGIFGRGVKIALFQGDHLYSGIERREGDERRAVDFHNRKIGKKRANTTQHLRSVA